MQKKIASELVWGAWGGIVCATIAFSAQVFGEPLPQTVWQAGMGGFFWLWAFAQHQELAGQQTVALTVHPISKI